jgi:protein O-GlcNAc transferase
MDRPSPLAQIGSGPPKPAPADAPLASARAHYEAGRFREAQEACDALYASDAYRSDNLLLLGAVHFQLRNFSEAIFYNQQAIRIDPDFAEAYGNLGNALKELGDLEGATQFYLKAIKLKPRFADAYNNLAGAYMQLGQSKQATETYRMALVLNPGLVDAHSNLGNLFKAQGRLSDAKRSFLEAIRIRPDFAIAWSNLAGVFREEGQLENAVAYYREALRLRPEFADAHSNLGNALKETGDLVGARAAYEEAIRLRPDFAVAHGNLGLCLFELGQHGAAVRTFKHAIQLEPNYPDAYTNLGNALREGSTGSGGGAEGIDEAIGCYRTALRLKPDHPHAYNNLGNALKDKGMAKEAVHCYMTAARLMPRFAAAHSNLGSLLKEQGKLEQALAHYQEAVKIDPLFADAFSNMGNAYKDLGRVDDAVRCYTTAIKIDPELPDAYSNLAAAYKDGGRVGDAITCLLKALKLKPNFPVAMASFVHCLALVSDWRERGARQAELAAVTRAQLGRVGAVPALQPFHALLYGMGAEGCTEDGATEEEVAAEAAADEAEAAEDARGAAGGDGARPRPRLLPLARRVAERNAARAVANVSLLELPPFSFKPRAPDARLRVGYVSSDYGNHPLSHLLQSVFGLHDRSRFEVTCYALGAADDSEWRAKIAAEAEHFVDLSAVPHGEAARRIHADGIHVLVDLNGYTKGARTEVFALEPAPIQMSFMGFCGTMGADYIHYIVGDATVIPTDQPQQRAADFAEKVLYLPRGLSCFANDHRQSARDVLDPELCPTRAAYGLPEDKFVFCCFNQVRSR